jgi:hypothetical protein
MEAVAWAVVPDLRLLCACWATAEQPAAAAVPRDGGGAHVSLPLLRQLEVICPCRGAPPAPIEELLQGSNTLRTVVADQLGAPRNRIPEQSTWRSLPPRPPATECLVGLRRSARRQSNSQRKEGRERKKKLGLGQEAAMGELTSAFLFPNRIGSRGRVFLGEQEGESPLLGMH